MCAVVPRAGVVPVGGVGAAAPPRARAGRRRRHRAAARHRPRRAARAHRARPRRELRRRTEEEVQDDRDEFRSATRHDHAVWRASDAVLGADGLNQHAVRITTLLTRIYVSPYT